MFDLEFDTPMLRARAVVESLEGLPGRHEVAVVRRGQPPLNREQIDVISA